MVRLWTNYKSCIAKESIKSWSHFGKQFGSSLLPYESAIALLGINPKKIESICPHKNLYTNVYSFMILNSQKVEIITLLIS